MTAKTAQTLYQGLVACIMTIAFAIAGYTMAGGLDTPGNVAGAVTQFGTVVHEYNADDANFNEDVVLDTSQVSDGH